MDSIAKYFKPEDDFLYKKGEQLGLQKGEQQGLQKGEQLKLEEKKTIIQKFLKPYKQSAYDLITAR